MQAQKFNADSIATTNNGRDFVREVLKNSIVQNSVPIAVTLNRENKITLGALKAIEPLISACVANSKNHSEIAENCRALFELVNESKEAITDQLQGESGTRPAWLDHMVFSVVVNWTAEAWRKYGDINEVKNCLNDNYIANDLAYALSGSSLITKDWMDKSSDPDVVSDENMAINQMRLSMSKSFFPLYMDIKNFSFWKDRVGADVVKEFARDLSEKINDLASSYANQLADSKKIDTEARLALWQSSINRVYSIAQQSYNNLAKRALTEVTNASTVDQKKTIRKEWATRHDLVNAVLTDTSFAMNEFNALVEEYINQQIAPANNDAKVNRHEQRTG